MSEATLPPMPEPFAKGVGAYPDIYTSDDLRSYALAIRRQAVEDVARFVESDYERQWVRPWRIDLAAAIRSLKENPATAG